MDYKLSLHYTFEYNNDFHYTQYLNINFNSYILSNNFISHNLSKLEDMVHIWNYLNKKGLHIHCILNNSLSNFCNYDYMVNKCVIVYPCQIL